MAVLLAHVRHGDQFLILDVALELGGIVAVPPSPVQLTAEHVAPTVTAIALAAGVALRSDDLHGVAVVAQHHSRPAPRAAELIQPKLDIHQRAVVDGGRFLLAVVSAAMARAHAADEGAAAPHDSAREPKLADDSLELRRAALPFLLQAA